MAYNKKNYYRKIIKIQEITQMQRHTFGLSYKEIFHLFIEDQFNISKRTYHEYLGVPAARKLKAMEAGERATATRQMKLNFDEK